MNIKTELIALRATLALAVIIACASTYYAHYTVEKFRVMTGLANEALVIAGKCTTGWTAASRDNYK